MRSSERDEAGKVSCGDDEVQPQRAKLGFNTVTCLCTSFTLLDYIHKEWKYVRKLNHAHV